MEEERRSLEAVTGQSRHSAAPVLASCADEERARGEKGIDTADNLLYNF